MQVYNTEPLFRNNKCKHIIINDMLRDNCHHSRDILIHLAGHGCESTPSMQLRTSGHKGSQAMLSSDCIFRKM